MSFCSRRQDFHIDARVDATAGRNGDAPYGRNPCSIVVRDNVVDLSDIHALVAKGQVGNGKHAHSAMVAVSKLHGVTFRNFLISLFNLAQESHKELAVVLFQQVARALPGPGGRQHVQSMSAPGGVVLVVQVVSGRCASIFGGKAGDRASRTHGAPHQQTCRRLPNNGFGRRAMS